MAKVWFIGRLGTVSLAAIALAFPLLMLIQTMAGGAVGGAVTSAIARAIGAGDMARAEKLVWHSLALALIGFLFFLLMYLVFGELLLVFLGGQGAILEQSQTFCLILFTNVFDLGTNLASFSQNLSKRRRLFNSFGDVTLMVSR